MASPEDRREQVHAFRLLAVFVLISGIGLWILARWITSPSESKSSPSISTADSSPRTTPPPPVLSQHEQRLAELRKKQESIVWSIAIEREMAKKLYDDFMKISTDPVPDPGERQYLLESMDKEHRRATELLAQKEAIDAEIATEEDGTKPTIEPEATTAAQGMVQGDIKQPPENSYKESESQEIQANDLTPEQAAHCMDTVGKHYAARLAIPTCQCMMLVYKKTGSQEKAAESMISCASLTMQALTHPGVTVSAR